MNPNILANFGIPFLPGALLADYTTFRLGGPCRGMFFCRDTNNIRQTVKFCRDQELPFIVIGGGSNIVVSDLGIDAYVIRFSSDNIDVEQTASSLCVSAATSVDALAEYAAQQGLAGINYLSGIPGTVGGAVTGNAGAFGKQIGDVVHAVTVIDDQNQLTRVPASDLRFSYRSSSLKEDNAILVHVELRMDKTDPSLLLKERGEIIGIRKEKHPDWHLTPCAGSFFRNVEPSSNVGRRQSAGWFLEQAGAKNLDHNGARVYEKHANIVVKGPVTKAQDVFDLSLDMAKMVKTKFGIDLAREVRFAGPFDGMPETSNLFW